MEECKQQEQKHPDATGAPATSSLSRFLGRLIGADDGLETVEWAIILGLIVAGAIGALAALGVWVAGIFEEVQNTLGV